MSNEPLRIQPESNTRIRRASNAGVTPVGEWMEWEEVKVPEDTKGGVDSKTAAENAADIVASLEDRKEADGSVLFNESVHSASRAHRVRFFGRCFVAAVRACTLHFLPNTWCEYLDFLVYTASWRDGVRDTFLNSIP